MVEIHLEEKKPPHGTAPHPTAYVAPIPVTLYSVPTSGL